MKHLRVALPLLLATLPAAQSASRASTQGGESPGATEERPLLLEARRMVPFDFARVTDLADLDGDGLPDGLLGRYDEAQASWGAVLLKNRGDGGFVEEEDRFPPMLNPPDLAVFHDFDADGDQDAILSIINYGAMFLDNDGTGTFTEITGVFDGFAQNGRGLALADLDLDGDQDLINAGSFSQVLVNTGAGFEDQGTLAPFFTVFATPPAVGDLDGDGAPDLVLGNGSSNGEANLVFLNDGAGDFGAGIHARLGDAYTDALLLLDADLDGDLDLVDGHRGSDDLYLNDGNASFELVPAIFPGEDGQTDDLTFFDEDADGDPDVFVAHRYDPVQMFASDGAGVFEDASERLHVLTGLQTRSVFAADLDADGDLDLRLDDARSPILLGDGTGSFFDPHTGSPAAFYPCCALTSFTVADFDGDGLPDVFTTRSGSAQDLRLNDGSGEFEDASERLPGRTEAERGVAAGDLDGDGDADLLAQSFLLLNEGAVFADATDTLPPAPGGRIVLGDVDADGDLDALVSAGMRALWRNDGAAGFTSEEDAVPDGPALGEHAAALGDLDGDGDLDGFFGGLVSFFGPLQEEAVLLGDGSGSFELLDGAVPIHPEGFFAGGLALGDVEGDGDLDVMHATFNEMTRFYVNDGTAHFSDVSERLPFLPQTEHVALGDLDDDGDLDAAFGAIFQTFAGQSAIFANDGTGFFAEASAGTALPHSEHVAITDADGDGDVDVLTPEGVLVNPDRALLRRAPARLGRALELDAFGEPAGVFLLMASERTAVRHLEPFGTLRLQAPFLLGRVLVLDAEGHAREAFAIPPEPALAGQRIAWQALVGGPPRFTNLELTRIEAY